jgi:hypothetical protein
MLMQSYSVDKKEKKRQNIGMSHCGGLPLVIQDSRTK